MGHPARRVLGKASFSGVPAVAGHRRLNGGRCDRLGFGGQLTEGPSSRRRVCVYTSRRVDAPRSTVPPEHDVCGWSCRRSCPLMQISVLLIRRLRPASRHESPARVQPRIVRSRCSLLRVTRDTPSPRRSQRFRWLPPLPCSRRPQQHFSYHVLVCGVRAHWQ
jgi:hypothetical protein